MKIDEVQDYDGRKFVVSCNECDVSDVALDKWADAVTAVRAHTCINSELAAFHLEQGVEQNFHVMYRIDDIGAFFVDWYCVECNDHTILENPTLQMMQQSLCVDMMHHECNPVRVPVSDLDYWQQKSKEETIK